MKTPEVRHAPHIIGRMNLPDRLKHHVTAEISAAYMRELMQRIGMSQVWIADQSGISRRRLQYLLVGSKVFDGQTQAVSLTYPEQFALEALACAGDAFRPPIAKT